jgi:hypothetical protein
VPSRPVHSSTEQRITVYVFVVIEFIVSPLDIPLADGARPRIAKIDGYAQRLIILPFHDDPTVLGFVRPVLATHGWAAARDDNFVVDPFLAPEG